MIRDFGLSDFYILLAATRWTLLLAIFGGVLGGVFGLILALASVAKSRILRIWAMGYITTIQGIPVLILLFLSYYGLSKMGYDLSPMMAASLSLAIYAGAYLADIWRAAINSVPQTQWLASTALGMRRGQQYRYIILPQSVRIAIPPTVGFVVQLVKNTAIVSIVGVVELARAAQLVNNVTFQPFRVFIAVGIIYFLICYPLSIAAKRLEVKFNIHHG